MPSQVVKCTSCNIVINEVLAFISNKIDVMDEQSISRICVTSFSESDIVTAKNLLFDSVSSAKRKKTRRRDGKSARDIDDIISLLKESDSEELPTFVARDLHKLPPILFDDVDPTQLLKDLLLLKKEINDIKNKYVTKEHFDVLKCDVDKVKSTQAAENTVNCSINYKRGACLFDNYNDIMACNSGPMGFDGNIKNIDNGCSPRESAARAPPQTNEATGAHAQQLTCNRPPVPITPRHTDVTDSENFSRGKDKLLSDVVRQGELKVVQYNKRRNRFKGNKGNANVADSKFKAADINIPIYIYNVSKEVTVPDIENYVSRRTGLNVMVEKNIMKLAKDYDGYKIFVPKHKLDLFMTNDFWPEGIAYRRFIDFRHRKVIEKNGTIINRDRNWVCENT
ncbi:uncharacterized protein LOC121737560 [Aricia agestis]|uniref:uncharacterized protein LOC121737560 n=1 Tax=Aricia agestis TaxID=91739 RepID=UPI001C20697E|nr:uncharacterized protein LOC121737560 [Aricia agestis]